MCSILGMRGSAFSDAVSAPSLQQCCGLSTRPRLSVGSPAKQQGSLGLAGGVLEDLGLVLRVLVGVIGGAAM